MKRCDRCGSEANFFWRVTVNGRSKEVSLCSSCAACERSAEEIDLFNEPFSPAPSAFYARAKTSEKPEKEKTLAPTEAKSLATHKAQLKRALRREDYIKAASLRDRIRAMEGKNT